MILFDINKCEFSYPKTEKIEPQNIGDATLLNKWDTEQYKIKFIFFAKQFVY